MVTAIETLVKFAATRRGSTQVGCERGPRAQRVGGRHRKGYRAQIGHLAPRLYTGAMRLVSFEVDGSSHYVNPEQVVELVARGAQTELRVAGSSDWLKVPAVVNEVVARLEEGKSGASAQAAPSSTGYRRIMVCLDGSELSELALDHAQRIAAGCGAELLLFTVAKLQVMGAEGMAAVGGGAHQETQYLDEVKARVQPGIVVASETRIGVPEDEILDAIEQQDVDLVVMTTRGRSGLARATLGSVTDKVIRGSGIPVLAICPSH